MSEIVNKIVDIDAVLDHGDWVKDKRGKRFLLIEQPSEWTEKGTDSKEPRYYQPFPFVSPFYYPSYPQYPTHPPYLPYPYILYRKDTSAGYPQ